MRIPLDDLPPEAITLLTILRRPRSLAWVLTDAPLARSAEALERAGFVRLSRDVFEGMGIYRVEVVRRGATAGGSGLTAGAM